MNLISLYQTVGAIARTKPNVNNYFETSPYIALQSRSVEYANVCFTVESFTDIEEIRQYRCILYYVDRLQNDGSNWLQVQQDATDIIWSIIDDIRNCDEISGVEEGYSVNYFNQRLSDYCGGAYAEINIDIPIDICIDYD